MYCSINKFVCVYINLYTCIIICLMFIVFVYSVLPKSIYTSAKKIIKKKFNSILIILRVLKIFYFKLMYLF